MHSRYRQLKFLVWQTCLLTVGLGAQDMPGLTPAPPGTTRACSLPGLTTGVESLGDAQLLAAYNAEADLVRSLQIYALVRGEGGKEYGSGAKQPRGLSTTIQLQAPELIRMTGFVPFADSRAFDIASDGREFRLLVPVDRETRFLVGPVEAPADSPNPKENIRPQPLFDAFRLPNGTSLGKTPAQPANRGVRVLSIQLLSLRGVPRAGEVEFDLRNGTVSSLSIYGPDEELIAQTRYTDWEQVPDQASGWEMGCYPRRIVLVQAKQHFQLDVRVLQVNLNPPMAKALFVLKPPRGIPVVKLNLSGARAAP